MGKRALQAPVGQSHFVNAGAILIVNVPLFDPQPLREEKDFLRIRGELRVVSFRGINTEQKSKWIVGKYEYVGVVLSQRVFAVRAEFQVRDVRPQRWIER